MSWQPEILTKDPETLLDNLAALQAVMGVDEEACKAAMKKSPELLLEDANAIGDKVRTAIMLQSYIWRMHMSCNQNVYVLESFLIVSGIILSTTAVAQTPKAPTAVNSYPSVCHCSINTLGTLLTRNQSQAGSTATLTLAYIFVLYDVLTVVPGATRVYLNPKP